MSIRVEQIQKRFGDFTALDDINLDVQEGQLVGLLGPSGSGKTTLLRIIAGLEKADQGKVLFHGKDVTNLDVRKRKVGFVFQQYALFRHLTVADNVAFGLRMLPRKVKLQPILADLQRGEHLRLSLAGAAWPAIGVNPGHDRHPCGPPGPHCQVVTMTLQLNGSKLRLLPWNSGKIDFDLPQEF